MIVSRGLTAELSFEQGLSECRNFLLVLLQEAHRGPDHFAFGLEASRRNLSCE
jgi:hypothetical protein